MIIIQINQQQFIRQIKKEKQKGNKILRINTIFSIMKNSTNKQKNNNLTSIINHFRHDQINQLNLHSNINQPVKLNQQNNIEYSKQFVYGLLSRLNSLQDKQKQNQTKFQDCIKSLRTQITLKDKINQTLKQQITSLKQQLIILKTKVQKYRQKTKQIKVIKLSKLLKSPSKIQKSPSTIQKSPSRMQKFPSKLQKSPQMNSQNEQKQNMSPYLIQSLCLSKNNKKLSQALAKAQSSRHDRMTRVPFKMDDFIINNGLRKDENEDYHMVKVVTQESQIDGLERKFSSYQRSASSTNRKTKSKSIGGLLISKLFAK